VTAERAAHLAALLTVLRESLGRLESGQLDIEDLDARRDAHLQALQASEPPELGSDSAEAERTSLEAIQFANTQLVTRLSEILGTTRERLMEADRGRRALGGYLQAARSGVRGGVRLGRW
jgi:hypothetical protein